MKALITIAALAAGWAAGASETIMPPAQQTALVQKYCVVCHSDAFRNGLLSLEHFDAARRDPGAAAMILSKLTNGAPLQLVLDARNDPAAAAAIAAKMKTGAMGAAGLGVPDRATQDALVIALGMEAAGADEWNLIQTGDGNTASILREVPSTAESYRLTIDCNATTRQGEIKLAWSPDVPDQGAILSVSADENQPSSYTIEGKEKMGNGANAASGPGAMPLTKLQGIPKRSLTVTGLFGAAPVVFPFAGLTPAMRQSLATCFTK